MGRLQNMFFQFTSYWSGKSYRCAYKKIDESLSILMINLWNIYNARALYNLSQIFERFFSVCNWLSIEHYPAFPISLRYPWIGNDQPNQTLAGGIKKYASLVISNKKEYDSNVNMTTTHISAFLEYSVLIFSTISVSVVVKSYPDRFWPDFVTISSPAFTLTRPLLVHCSTQPLVSGLLCIAYCSTGCWLDERWDGSKLEWIDIGHDN